MSHVDIRIPTPLRGFTAGKDQVSVEATNVAQAFLSLVERHPTLRKHLLTEDDQLRHFINVYVGDKDIRHLAGLETLLSEGDVIAIIPAVAGGVT